MGPRRVEVKLESQVGSVDLGEELALQMAGTAGFSEEERYKIGMAVRELVINALKHGNAGQADKPVSLSFLLHEDRLVVRVRDQGKGFKLDEIPDPLADENLLKSSGRGLFLVRCFMDELVVESANGGGAVVTMTKRIQAKDGNPAESKEEKQQ